MQSNSVIVYEGKKMHALRHKLISYRITKTMIQNTLYPNDTEHLISQLRIFLMNQRLMEKVREPKELFH